MKFMLTVILSLSLTACASMGLRSDAQKIQFGCAAATTALEVLTEANRAGKISAAQKTEISKAGNELVPICMAPTTPTLDDLKKAGFAAAIARLQALALEHTTP